MVWCMVGGLVPVLDVMYVQIITAMGLREDLGESLGEDLGEGPGEGLEEEPATESPGTRNVNAR